MRQVERKKKRSLKHGRIWIAAGSLLLLAGSAAVYLLWPAAAKKAGEEPVSGEIRAVVSGMTGGEATVPQPYTAEEEPDTRGTLGEREPEELESATVTVRGRAPWTVIRDGEGNLRLQGAGDWTVKERLAERIRSAMTDLVYEDIITEDPAEYRDRLADFGLAEPWIIARAQYADGQEVTFRIGDHVPVEKDVRYMTIDGDGRLFAVAGSLAEDLDIEQEALHPVTQPEIYPVLLDRITVTGKDGKEQAEWRLRGKITDPDAGTNWEITAPFRYCADEGMIRNLKTSAENLRMGVFMDDATEETLARYGLADPDYRLELHMAAGSTGTVSEFGVYDVVEREGGTVTLDIARDEGGMIDYVRFGEEIFRVNHYLSLSAFLDTDPADTAALYIAPVPKDSLERMTVEQEGVTVTYTVERTGETNPETAEEIVICRKDGAEISREAFEAAYDRLMTVTVDGSLPENTRVNAPHTKYTFRAASGGTHTVELSEWNGMHDAVTLDGETRFYIVRQEAGFTYSE